MIERYYHEAEGYNPFLIREGWQVAQLNYLPGHGLDDMVDVEVHRQTDEMPVFVEKADKILGEHRFPRAGTAVLVAAEIGDEGISFECVRMTPGVTYNIPAGVWHNIGMSRDARMIIVERDGTHLHDGLHRPLSDAEAEQLRAAVAEALKKGDACR